MNAGLTLSVWALVALDCALMGYRLAMGQSALLDKRRRHQRASIGAGLASIVPLATVTAMAALLASQAGDGATEELNAAMGRFVMMGGAYAAVILAASALCLIPSYTVRAAASVVIFGPLTLLRPLVVVVTVAVAVGPGAAPWLVAVGLLVAIPGVTIEPVLDRRIARELVAPTPVG